MVLNGVNFPEPAIAEFCRNHGIARLSLFGSILRDDFGPESDVDVLVVFTPDAHPKLFSIANTEAERGESIGRKVDLRTAAELSRYFRADVVAKARLLHAA